MARRRAEVLLIEDDPGDVDLTREALADDRAGVNLHVVEDGEKAMAFLRRQAPYQQAVRPDLILLDLNLPRVSGREVLRQIKRDETLRAIPVVVLTTSDAETDITRSYDLGANCYVTKPFGLDRVSQVVQSIQGFWLSTATLPPRRAT